MLCTIRPSVDSIYCTSTLSLYARQIAIHEDMARIQQYTEVFHC